jgi:D-aminopeptidase
VLRQRIFEPVGMHATHLRRRDRDFLPNSASTHMPKGTGFDKSEYAGERFGENGVVSSADDMLRWMAHMDSPVVGNPGTWAAMKSAGTLANGSSTEYGLGLFSKKYRGVDIVYHGGGGVNGNSCMLKIPAAKLDIMVMVNRGDVSSMDLASKVVDAIVPGLDAPATRGVNSTLTGVFSSLATGRAVQFFIANGEQRAWIDNYNLLMDVGPDGVMRSREPFPLKLSITPVGAGDITTVVLNDFGNEHSLSRMPDGEVPPEKSLLGRYGADCGGIEATIYETAEGVEIQTDSTLGRARFPLVFRGGRIWHAESPLHFFSGIVTVVNGDEFRFTTARSGALTFRRFS